MQNSQLLSTARRLKRLHANDEPSEQEQRRASARMIAAVWDAERETMDKRRFTWPVFAMAAAVAAILLLVVLNPFNTVSEQHFGVRSGDAELSFLLDPTTTATRESRFTLAYSLNETRSAPTFLAAFVVDADREIHWLYPAYLDASQNPAFVELAPNQTMTTLPQAVQFDDLAIGSLRVFLVATETPARVSDIESLSKDMLDESLRDRLLTRFPGAIIDVRHLQVTQ